MKIFKKESNLEKIIICFYFAVAAVEVCAELFSYKPILFVFKPMISLLLMLLYWNSSIQRNSLFFLVIFFSLVTNVFFIPNTEKMLFIGLLAFSVHRILTIFYLIKLTKIKDCIPLLIATIPFLFFFFYLLSISGEMKESRHIVLIIQNILVSVLGGITISDYMMNNKRKNPWLLIFGLLSVTLYFIVFIEKYYLSDLSPGIFRPMAMILNTMVYYTFYKFVIETERSNDN
jgi:hypothetical protein